MKTIKTKKVKYEAIFSNCSSLQETCPVLYNYLRSHMKLSQKCALGIGAAMFTHQHLCFSVKGDLRNKNVPVLLSGMCMNTQSWSWTCPKLLETLTELVTARSIAIQHMKGKVCLSLDFESIPACAILPSLHHCTTFLAQTTRLGIAFLPVHYFFIGLYLGSRVTRCVLEALGLLCVSPIPSVQ